MLISGIFGMFYNKLHHIIFELNAGYEIPQHIDIYQEQHIVGTVGELINRKILC